MLSNRSRSAPDPGLTCAGNAPRRDHSWVVGLLGAAILAAGAGCSNGSGPPPPNIVILTLDTTRFDRLSCYGSTSVRTPALDAIAERGVRFEHAFTPVPLTLPAHASLFTGLYPAGHGVHDNTYYRLVPPLETLAEVLARNGYQTAAFISAFVLNSEYGIAQGFETFDDSVKYRPATAGIFSERSGAETNAAALEWLSRRTDRSRPFLLWIHYFDPHAPYAAPERFRAGSDGSIAREYDAEVAFVDACVGEVMSAIDAQGLTGSTVVVAASDHGEALGQHGEETHGFFLYDETVRIPLLIAAPGLLPEGRVVDTGLAGLVDVMPTVLDLAGIPSRELTFHGKSLVPAARGSGALSREVLLESFMAAENLGWGRLWGLRTPEHKLIEAPRPELYDLVADPGELTDLAGTAPDLLATMRDRWGRLEAEAIASGATGGLSARADVDEEKRAKLEALGYLASRSASSTRSDTTTGAGSGASFNPKDGVDVYNTLMLAMRRRYEGEVAEANALFGQVVAALPDNSAVRMMYGRSLEVAKANDEAAAMYEAAVRLEPGLVDAWLALGAVELKRHRPEAAAEAFESVGRILGSSEGSTTSGAAPYRLLAAWEGLIEARFAQGRAEDARRVIAKLRLEVSDDPAWLRKIAQKCADGGAWEEAAALLREAFDQEPEDAILRINLATALTRSGAPDEALRILEDGLARGEKPGLLLRHIGLVNEMAGRTEAAIAGYRRYLEMWPKDTQVLERVRTLQTEEKHDGE